MHLDEGFVRAATWLPLTKYTVHRQGIPNKRQGEMKWFGASRSVPLARVNKRPHRR